MLTFKRNLILGIGCRKGKALEDIEAAVALALANRSLDEVRLVTSIDIKTEEEGILKFCHKYNLPLQFFSKDDLDKIKKVFKASKWVNKSIGIDGVCEPCALAGSINGTLLVPKMIHQGVTIAIVEDKT